MDVEKFQDDVYSITERLSEHLSPELTPKLNFVRQNLIESYKKNLVKINHSVLELICAAELISHGFSVDVEKSISDVLVCDLFGKKNDGTAIIEIETGFTPPEHALDTVDYYAARIVSKIARYSKHCGKFSLATPVVSCSLTDTSERLDLLREALEDVVLGAKASEIMLCEGSELSVEVELEAVEDPD